MAVMALLAEHPDVVARRVSAAVIASSGAAQIVSRPLAVVGRQVLGNAHVDRLLAGPAGPVFLRAAVGSRPTLGHLQAGRDTFLATAPDVRLTFFAAIGAADLLPGLAAVETPTTVVVGSRDLLTPPRRARAVANAIPGAHLVVLPGAGHMLPFETPDELANLIASAGRDEPARQRAMNEEPHA
jgi:pimeloyl-ACP methyl ester carboxylesterase